MSRRIGGRSPPDESPLDGQPNDRSAKKSGRSKPGGKKLQCVVVTPEKTLFDDWVDFVALPLYDGELGVLPGRAPLIGRLGFGELRTKTGEVARRYFVDGGFVQVRDNVVTVLTNRAVPAQQLDAAARRQGARDARVPARGRRGRIPRTRKSNRPGARTDPRRQAQERELTKQENKPRKRTNHERHEITRKNPFQEMHFKKCVSRNM